ncbi:hypothetical protein PFLUV_G00239440 [Perca fluviatilis]|uniref:Uncharacterized protein n=1 Tax=Perca fluviatilis TaxID=8168 RepID=A0A6A5EBX1_PERFL|nr:hypothetical protein PFLUV_G00239440 [Perca fluviatilis]
MEPVPGWSRFNEARVVETRHTALPRRLTLAVSHGGGGLRGGLRAWRHRRLLAASRCSAAVGRADGAAGLGPERGGVGGAVPSWPSSLLTSFGLPRQPVVRTETCLSFQRISFLFTEETEAREARRLLTLTWLGGPS